MPWSRRIFTSLSSTIRILAFKISDKLTMPFALTSFAHRLFREFQRCIQRTHELIHLYWLGEIAEESSLQTLFDITWNCIRAESDDGNVRRRRILAKDFQSFDPTDTWKIDVH